MRQRTKKPAGRAATDKAPAKLRSAPATRGQAAKPKRTAATVRKKTPAKPRRNGPAPDQTLAQLRAERDEARAQQAATAEILEIINRSSGDPAPVFDAILERAMRLCDAVFGGLLVPDGEFIKYLTFHNVPERFTNFLTHNRIRARTMFGPDWSTGATFSIADLSQSEGYRRRVPVTVSAVEDGGIRAMLLVPMTREGAFVGAFTVYRREVRPFTERQIAIAQSFADQAMIAMENARLLTETREALEKQTATAEILRVISGSPTDLQPTFEAIAARATRLSGAVTGNVSRFDGSLIHYGAGYGMADAETKDVHAAFPQPPGRGSATARAILTRGIVQIHDPAADPDYAQAHLVRYGTVLSIPMLRDGKPLGAITVTRHQIKPFTEAQIDLLKTFADQAVIAIENVRLFNELRERTDDLQQSLEYQTATSDVLKVISRSTFDLQPVLDKLVETAQYLCGADGGSALTLRDGEVYRYAAMHGVSDEFRDTLLRQIVVAGRETIAGRVVLEGKVIHVADLAAEPEFVMRAAVTVDRIGSVLGVPMLREGRVVGTLSLARRRVEPFTDRQVELVRTFADQAVIAIENARLLTELRESLEYQTATSDVLKVFSRSTFDLRPVLDTLMQTAARLCNAEGGGLTVREGDGFRYMATHGLSKELAAVVQARPYLPNRGSIAGRTAVEGKVVQIEDLATDPEYVLQDVKELKEIHSALGVPMIRDGVVFGTFSLTRNHVERFTDRQVELVRTFADQAVIAIENARLLTELRESLDRQTAMSEVLGVISASPGQVQPVFEKMLECALRLCRAHMGVIQEATDGAFTQVAKLGAPPEFSFRLDNYRPPPDTGLGKMLATKSTIRVDDYRATEGYAAGNPAIVALVDQGRGRSAIQVPMVKDGEVVGAMTIYRPEVRPFDDRDATIAEDFAKQAVIAIENARLLTELRARTADLQESLEYQTATSDVLKVISRSTFDLQPVLDTLIQTAGRLCESDNGGLAIRDGDVFRYAAFHGCPAELQALLQSTPIVPGRGSIAGRTALEGKVVHVLDLATDPEYAIPESVTMAKIGTSLGVPLLREGRVVGTLAMNRTRVEPFTERQIELLRTFADQAVIAIENARLLTELRQSLEQQQAIAEVLQVINASPGNLRPVFDAMLDKAQSLGGAAYGNMQLWDGEVFRVVATSGQSAFSVGGTYRPDAPNDPTRRLIAGESVVHIADIRDVNDAFSRRAAAAGTRTVVLVPLRRESTLLGNIFLVRREVRPFTDKEIALLQSFAAQAVIAIDNARLLTELRERTTDLQQSLEYQTATSDVLKVISRSTFDLTPVLQYVLETAMRLCRTDGGSIFRLDGTIYRWAVGKGLDPIYEEIEKNTPIVPDEGTVVGRAALRCQTVQIVDAWNDPLYTQKESARITQARTMLGVPLLREGAPIGVIAMARNVVEPFTDNEIELVTTFADQAVIAIENARLLTELRESLEQQQAIAEVLQVINASPGNLAPVYDAMLEKAASLCDARLGFLCSYDGETQILLASRGASPEVVEMARRVPIEPASSVGRLALGKYEFIHTPDITDDPVYRSGVSSRRLFADATGARTALWVALRKDDVLIGVFILYRTEVRPFTDKQIALLQSFAAQAVIAMDNARLLTELRESLDRQTAMSEVLSVISASPGQVQPVFEKMLECALRLCRAHMGLINRATDGAFTTVARIGTPPGFSFELDNYRPPPDTGMGQMLVTKSTIRIDDYIATGYANRNPAIMALVEQGGARSAMQVPMVKDGEVVGNMTIYRPEVRPFNDQDMAIAEDFAKQAVIAVDNARLLTELRESLEQQQAMAEVLQVINASPGNLAPVYDAILDKAHTLCGAAHGSMHLWDGNEFETVAVSGKSAFTVGQRERLGGPNYLPRRLVAGESVVHVVDMRDVDDATLRRAAARGTRSAVLVPLRKENTLLGLISAARDEVRPFTDKEIALLQSFAAQAVIAMDNARLLDEIRQRQAELRVTFDNMGDAVIMFDAEQRLVAWNQNFLHMLDIPEEWLATPRTYGDFAAYLTERGEFGDTPPPDLGAPDTGEVRSIRYERTRPDGRVLEVRRNPIPGGAGFVFIYSDITERKQAEQSILAAREAAEHALADLKLAQANLIQSEKMASLGALTAGIAHEIKNPLNFVNNFANLSNELLGELKETAAPAFATLDAGKREEVDETMAMLTGNLEKIQEHGKRADGIVKSMLAHSRGGSGDRREADINALVEESLNLAYHGARALDQNFNITLERDYDKAMKPIELVPQDVTRVFLNLCGNGFYAANKRRKEGGNEGFRPVLKVTTKELGDAVEVRIRDNGTGIPPDVKDKLFQPFFTTKPTGEGTGLGLSISYDIVTQQHGGTIAVDSRVGDFTEFTIRLPRKR